MNTILKIILAINLTVIALLVFIYPHLMVAPGKLIQGHQHLETDCFACHSPFTGADSERCLVCHKLAEIGLLTSTGQVIAKPANVIRFHQQLAGRNCIACHSDHDSIKRSQHQGQFNHALLKKELGSRCHDCHAVPKDLLHQQIAGNCSQCHNQEKWLPTTFDHHKYFKLDNEHNARCVVCHGGSDFSRYTCYGCHEHTPETIRNEHLEEGIRDFDNCVHCHRSSDKHDIRNEHGKNETEHEDD
ncbi:MAG: cytochrome c3 family protein [Methylococcales bacterium]